MGRTGKNDLWRRCKALLVLGACAGAAHLPTLADGDELFISGYPAANESRSLASAATSLETGALSTPAAAVPLEARHRTWDASDGIALRTDKFHVMIILFR